MTTEVDVPEKPRRNYTGSQVFPVVAALMFGVSVPIWLIVLRLESQEMPPEALLLGAAILLAAFLAGELFPLQIEVRRETLLVSGSELPMVLGLLLLPAWTVGLTHVAAGALVFLIRRDSWRNIAVNLSFITVETGTAALVMNLISDPDSPTGIKYLGVALGVLAGALMSAVAVGLTYRLLGPAEPLLRVIGRSMLSAAAIVTFALAGYTVWQPWPYGPIVCIALAAVLGVIYRTYFLFLRQHADLTRMYSFGRQVTNVGSAIDDWRGVLEQVRDQLNAEVAVLRLNDGESALRTLAIGPEGVLDEPPMQEDDPLLTMARITGRARASTDRSPNPEVLAALAERRSWDVLVVPLQSGDRDRGYLEVRDRLSRWGRFRDEDLQLLETLSGHVATALDNLRLLGIPAPRGLSRRDHGTAQPARPARRRPGGDHPGLGWRDPAGRVGRAVPGQQCARARPRRAAAANGRRTTGGTGRRLPTGRPDRGGSVRRAGRRDVRGRADRVGHRDPGHRRPGLLAGRHRG